MPSISLSLWQMCSSRNSTRRLHEYVTNGTSQTYKVPSVIQADLVIFFSSNNLYICLSKINENRLNVQKFLFLWGSQVELFLSVRAVNTEFHQNVISDNCQVPLIRSDCPQLTD
jgi:hypothetical protein